MLNILLITSALMLIFTNLVFIGLLIKQVAGQDVKSKIVTIGLIITLLVMTSFVVFMPYFMELI